MGTKRAIWAGAVACLSACQSHVAPPAAEFVRPAVPITAVSLAEIQVRLERVELSGAREIDEAANQTAASNLELAVTDALYEVGIRVGRKPLPFESLALSRHVLRSVDSDRIDRTHLTTLSAWAIDVPKAAERTPPPVLIIFAEARINSAGHKLAQAGLSLTLLTPEGINDGSGRIHAGLFDGETGQLIWSIHMPRSDVLDPDEARTVADKLAARFEADLK